MTNMENLLEKMAILLLVFIGEFVFTITFILSMEYGLILLGILSAFLFAITLVIGVFILKASDYVHSHFKILKHDF